MAEPNSLPEDETESYELVTCDLSALAPEDFRHWVSNAVVQCMMATEAGPRIDRNKLTDLIERHFDRLVNGNQLDFEPVLAALCRIQGVAEASLYVGIVNLQSRLANLNIDMALPDMKLDQWTRAQLLREAHEATERARADHEQSRLQSAVADLNRARLGALLVQEQLIDETELSEALAQQQNTGGRLGSNLVQLGFVSEADLARFLGRQLGLPSITDISHVSPEARRAVPQELLLKHRVVPLAVDAKEIQIAMVDPTDLMALDEIGFVTDRRVRPVVAPELVVDFAQARFFGIRRPPRLLAVTAAPDGGPPSWPRSVYSRGPVVLPPPTEEPYDLAELAHDLLTSEVPEDVFAPLWRLWTEKFHLSAQFIVSEGMARGGRITGAQTPAEAFEKAQVPACSHPVLDEIVSTQQPYRGPCGHAIGSHWLSEQLGLTASAMVFAVPVREVNDQVVGIMVGHLPRGEIPESSWMEAVDLACHAALRMVQARRAIRRVQTAGRPTVRRARAPGLAR